MACVPCLDERTNPHIGSCGQAEGCQKQRTCAMHDHAPNRLSCDWAIWLPTLQRAGPRAYLTEKDVACERVLTDPVQTAQYAQRRQAPP